MAKEFVEIVNMMIESHKWLNKEEK